MINGKRDAYGMYMDNRHKGLESEFLGADVSIGGRIHKEKSVNLRLPFVNRIKVLFRSLRNDKDFALNRTRSYEVEILPLPVQKASRQSRLSGANAIKPMATVAALLISGKVDRIWTINRESGRERQQTPSNLG